MRENSVTYFTTNQSGLTLTLHSEQLPNHHNSTLFTDPISHTRKNEDANEIDWINRLIHTTPNGSLYYDNDLRKMLQQGSDVTLVHVTLSLDDIRKSGRIYPSVGCLGATIFSVPLRSDGKLHNFTQYILDREVPSIIKNRNNPKAASLIGIKIKAAALNKQKNYSFNYLLIGRLQLDTYNHMKTSFKSKDDEDIFTKFQATILDDVGYARDFLNTCHDYKLDEIGDKVFFEHFSVAMKHVSFLGYIYFEVLSEYVQLHQTDRESVELRSKGELNIKHFKDLVYKITPSLNEGFDLEKFQPSIQDVISSLKEMDNTRKLFGYFDEEEFMYFMKWRLAQMIRLKVLDRQRIDKSLDFNTRSSLLGHIIHRKIGEDKTMDPYLFIYDQGRAKTIWDSWRSSDITLVENSVMPRGEIGINPLADSNDYEIYLLDHDPISKKVIFKERLDVYIEPSIICNNSLMGSSNNPKAQD